MSRACPQCSSPFHYGDGELEVVECADCGAEYEWTPEEEGEDN